ncbi:AAA family ATPase [Rhodococcus ruber]|uniref:AAA family ATPase n=1 Tax=Rhodococcus ruber TaxID=1830 RepID=UPI00177F178B|nr:AAA family ATPase [Rhodococcus ruber]MBD8057247.1 AAA family ATPase [Rhodococcus ruber]
MTTARERAMFDAAELVDPFDQVLDVEPVAGPDSGGAERETVAGPGSGGLSARLLTRSDLRTLPDPAPLVDNVLDQGTTALLYGPWGSGKSFVALDWAASVACGRRWQGRTVERRRVLYVAAEGAFGLKGRLHAWETAWKQSIEDGWLDVLPEPVNLTHGLRVSELVELVAVCGYGLVVLDTLARCMVGADENSAKDSGVVVDALSRIREGTPGGRGTVLGVHHTGKDGKTLRGSSAFEAGVDTVYQVEPDGVALELRRTKRKDGPCEDSHRLMVSPVEGTESAVVSVRRGADMNGNAARLLSAFVEMFSDTGASQSALRDAVDLAPASFHRSVNELVKSGALIREERSRGVYFRLPD